MLTVILLFFCATANKKAKLIVTTASVTSSATQNGTNNNEHNNSISGSQQQQHQHQYGVKQFSISVEEQYYTQSQVESSNCASGNGTGENGLLKNQYDITRPGSSTGSTCGPKLVNKQLVLPFVPPSFPNNSEDGANHLIKPSEYLKSITDKKSIAGSTR